MGLNTLSFPQPKSAPRIYQKGGIGLFDDSPFLLCKKIIEKDHLVISVVHQKRAESIKLIPRPIFDHRPLLWIFKGPKYVVEMNEHPAFELRQDFEQFEADVATGLQNVGGVDKKHIVSVKRSK